MTERVVVENEEYRLVAAETEEAVVLHVRLMDGFTQAAAEAAFWRDLNELAVEGLIDIGGYAGGTPVLPDEVDDGDSGADG